MSISSPELWKRIAQEGIASPLQCRTWAAEAAKSMPAQDTADGLKMALQLIEQGHLTKYQAKSLVGQSEQPLRLGRFHIRQHLKTPIWREWIEVAEIDLTKPKDTVVSWGRCLSLNQVQGMEPRRPSLKRAIALSHLEHPHLQKIFLPEMMEGGARDLLVRLQPVEGKPLSAFFLEQPAAESDGRQIIDQVAQALVVLHNAGIVHGLPNPDRIYWDGENAKLVVDPIAAETPVGLDANNQHAVLGSTMKQGERLTFAAPEFVAPQHRPNVSSDVFALAKTWNWLLGDRDEPHRGVEQALSANAVCNLGTQASKLDAPLQKVLLHGLAPNPSHRFANSAAFAKAISVAERVIETGRVVPGAKVDQLEKPVAEAKALIAKPESKKLNPTQDAGHSIGEKASTTRGRKNPVVTATASEPTSPGSKSSAPKAQPLQEVKSKAGQDPKKKEMSPSKAKLNPTDRKKSQTPTPNTSDKAQRKPVSDSNAPIGDREVEPKQANLVSGAEQAALVTRSERSAKVAQSKPGEPEKPSTGKTGAPQSKPKGSSPSNAASGSRKPGARGKRRKQSNKWMLPVIGGFGVLIVLLLALQFSGALEGMRKERQASKPPPAYVPKSTSKPKVIEKDPLLDFYNVVDDDQGLWAPPNPPAPPPLNMLPPGAGLFLWMRVDQILVKPERLGINALWNDGQQFDEWLRELAGIDSDLIQSAIVAMYSPDQDGGFPKSAIRVNLADAVSKDQFAGMIGEPAEWIDENQISSGAKRYFVLVTDENTVSEFSVGPDDLMEEVAELQGGAGPLLRNVETLFEASSEKDDVFVVASAPFLIAEGRGLLDAVPERGRQAVSRLLGADARAISFASSMDESWFYELRIVGTANQEAAAFAVKLSRGVQGLADRVEAWFVEELPHPHWRALALRYPQMLRTFSRWTRIGVEDGVAVLNGYLPVGAADNLLLASSIALNDAATVSGGFSTEGTDGPSSQRSLSTEEFLARKITLSFDQEPIEEAFRMVAEEANSGLPAGTEPLEFRLDGDAFELGGITRNFQLRDFQHQDAPVRDALTEIAKRGNPNTTVTDLSDPNQSLVWSIQPSAKDPSKAAVVLTTRNAVASGEGQLADEFNK
ncbi:MAG: hypothetical protein ACE361_12340 [Aureliella sp.]